MSSQGEGSEAKHNRPKEYPPSSVFKEGWVAISSQPKPRKDKDEWCKLNTRYCVLQQENGSKTLQIYESSTKTGIPLFVCLDSAQKATELYTIVFPKPLFEIRTREGRVLCLMSAEVPAMSEWFSCLSEAIVSIRNHQEDSQRAQQPHNSLSTGRHKSGRYPRKPSTVHVKKEGWLAVRIYSEYSKDTLDELKPKYCSLEQKDNHFRLNIFEDASKAGDMVTLHLDTAVEGGQHTELYRERRCDVLTADGEVLCVLSAEENAIKEWYASLKAAIKSATKDKGDTMSDESTSSGKDEPGAMSPLDAEAEFLNAWFPDLENECYIIPPMHIDTMQTRDILTGGFNIEMYKTEKEVKSKVGKNIMEIDMVLKKIHTCMEKIKQKEEQKGEAMVIMTQAKCGEYGARSKSLYAGAAKRIKEDCEDDPLDPLELQTDFVDLLAIHRTHGIFMGAIVRQTGRKLVEKNITDVVDYLEKSAGCVKKYVFEDMVVQPEIKQAILLPNVTRACLKKTLDGMQDLEELKERLGVKDPWRTFDELCLCEDDMSDAKRLDMWWTKHMKGSEGCEEEDYAMPGGSVYRQLVTRFAVPITTVKIFLSTQPRLQLWTAGHVVDAVGEEYGREMTRLALFPFQVALLEAPEDGDDDIIFLEGPPGTGKTILLVLKGIGWADEGCDTIYVVNTGMNSAAVPILLEMLLIQNVEQSDFSLYYFDISGTADDQIEYLCDQAARTPDKPACILADEVNCDRAYRLYTALKERKCKVKMWAAGVRLDGIHDFPKFKDVRQLREPLRCPQTIVREVEMANDILRDKKVLPYSAPSVPPPCDGPAVITIEHYGPQYKGNRQGHKAEGKMDTPWRCVECGVRVAKALVDKLHIGNQGNASRRQSGLHYNDVFVLAMHMECGEYISDDDEYSPAPFVRGLQSAGIPTRKVGPKDTETLKQVVENSFVDNGDAVTIVHESVIWGLERKVIVYLSYKDRGVIDTAASTGRLYAMSRSTSQVIWVKQVLS